MTIDASTGSKIESCLDAARACGEALAFLRADKSRADSVLESVLMEAARVSALTADCLVRVPDIREMVLRVCVEICERAALACARYKDVAPLLECGEALAACAAMCTAPAEIDMVVAGSSGGQERPRQLH